MKRLLPPLAALFIALLPSACTFFGVRVRTDDPSHTALRSFLQQVETHDALLSFEDDSPTHYRLHGAMAKPGTSLYHFRTVLIPRDQLSPSVVAELTKLRHAPGTPGFQPQDSKAIARRILNQLPAGDG